MNRKYCSKTGVQLMMKKDVTCGIYTKWSKVDKWEAQIGSKLEKFGEFTQIKFGCNLPNNQNYINLI